MDVGTRIKTRRKALGYSAEDLAAIIGVSPATVYRYESSDIMNMRIDKLKPIAEALKTTPAYLMGWENEISSPSQPITPKNNTSINTDERTLSVSALDIAHKYEQLDQHSQKLVSTVIDMELQRPVADEMPLVHSYEDMVEAFSIPASEDSDPLAEAE